MRESSYAIKLRLSLHISIMPATLGPFKLNRGKRVALFGILGRRFKRLLQQGPLFTQRCLNG